MIDGANYGQVQIIVRACLIGLMRWTVGCCVLLELIGSVIRKGNNFTSSPKNSHNVQMYM